MISLLKPIDETLLETTIGYEQLAVDLTAFLAKRSVDKNVKNALDFALLRLTFESKTRLTLQIQNPQLKIQNHFLRRGASR